MSTNVSKERRERLIEEIKAIKTYIASAPQDENTAALLSYIAEIEKDIKNKKYGLVFEEHSADDRYSNPDNDPRGPWKAADSTVGPAISEKVYGITLPSGRVVFPATGRCWLYTKKRFDEMVNENRVWFGADGNSTPAIKKFLSEVKQGITPMTIWKYTEVGHSQDATKELKDIFDGEAKFTYPKSVRLIQRVVGLYGNKNSTVLDFFAGSGTTGHAVMKLNAEDNGERTFILCTNNENNICREVTYERIKRVIARDNFPASLKYFKVDYIPISDKLYYEYADELLHHIRELVELENGINFTGNDEIAILLTEEELDAFAASMSENTVCKTIYLGHDVLTSEAQEKLFKKYNITINVIPDYYYRDLEG